MGTETIGGLEQFLIILSGCLFASVVYHLRIISCYAAKLSELYIAKDGNRVNQYDSGKSKIHNPDVYWKLTSMAAGIAFIYVMMKL